MKKIIESIQRKLSQMNQKTRYYVLASVVAAIFLIDVLLIMVPQVMIISKLSANSKTHVDNLSQFKNNNARVAQYREQLKLLEDGIADATSIVRSEEEVPIVLEQISRIARDYSIKIDQVMPLKETKRELVQNNDGVYYALSLSVYAQGGYHDFGRFLNALENERAFFKVQKLIIEGASKNINRHDLNLLIDIIVLEQAA